MPLPCEAAYILRVRWARWTALCQLPLSRGQGLQLALLSSGLLICRRQWSAALDQPSPAQHSAGITPVRRLRVPHTLMCRQLPGRGRFQHAVGMLRNVGSRCMTDLHIHAAEPLKSMRACSNFAFIERCHARSQCKEWCRGTLGIVYLQCVSISLVHNFGSRAHAPAPGSPGNSGFTSFGWMLAWPSHKQSLFWSDLNNVGPRYRAPLGMFCDSYCARRQWRNSSASRKDFGGCEEVCLPPSIWCQHHRLICVASCVLLVLGSTAYKAKTHTQCFTFDCGTALRVNDAGSCNLVVLPSSASAHFHMKLTCKSKCAGCTVQMLTSES